jgi:hypothetical protein
MTLTLTSTLVDTAANGGSKPLPMLRKLRAVVRPSQVHVILHFARHPLARSRNVLFRRYIWTDVRQSLDGKASARKFSGHTLWARLLSTMPAWNLQRFCNGVAEIRGNLRITILP